MAESRREIPLFLGLCGLVALFLVGIGNWLHLGLGAGDAFPSGSSLRGDPLGGRAWFDAMQTLPGLTVRRNYDPFADIEAGPGTTLILANLSVFQLGSMEPEKLDGLDAFVQRGGRLVLAVRGDAGDGGIEDRWGLALGPIASTEGATPDATIEDPLDSFQPVAEVSRAIAVPGGPAGLEGALTWRGALWITRNTHDWRILYTRSDLPVLADRALGEGSIVVMADPYLLSNEALWRDRAPGLLSWIVGTSSEVVFDETHLGIQNSPGVAGLARTYRLHGILAGLLLLAGLYAWRNATSLVPPMAVEEDESDAVAGRDSASAFVNLLRRSVPVGVLLRTCYETWRDLGAPIPDKAKKGEEIKVIVDDMGPDDVVARYVACCRVVNRRS